MNEADVNRPPHASPFGTAAGFAASGSGAAASFFTPPAAEPGSRPAEPDPAVSPYTAPYTPPVHHPGVPPFLAFLLGFIPGVGAICNGQYAKGMIHAVIFGLLVSAEASRIPAPMHALLGILIAAWVFYMAFEALHTASRRRRGIPVDELSSIFEIRPSHNRLPLGAVLLVLVGFLLLLQTTDIISGEVFARYWPVLLIVIGVYLLYGRTRSAPPNSTGRDMEAPR